MTTDIVSSNASAGDSVQSAFRRELDCFQTALATLALEIPEDFVPCRQDAFHKRVETAFVQSQAACRAFEQANLAYPERVLEAQEMFRQETNPWFGKSWIAHRARTKPSGFAGDYEMLVKLYDEATPTTGLGGYLDLCILELPLARAVRARLIAARSFLISEIEGRSGDVRILDIASGPCREYQDWPSFGPKRRVEIVAMDNDPLALQYVNSYVAAGLSSETVLTPSRYNALRTRSAETTRKAFGSFDILYSVGLCDYLSDEHLIRLLGAWNDTLNEGGILYIAFKDTEQYDQTPYQWHLDWFFYQRTLEDVLRLYQAAGFKCEEIETRRDTTGIIVNFICKRQALDLTRVDQAHSGQLRRQAKRTKVTDQQD